MLIQFETESSFFLLDFAEKVWLKTVVAPTLDEGEIVIKEVLEQGVLSTSGYKTWSLGRKSPNLSTVGIDIIGTGTTMVIYVRANSKISNLTMPKPIKTILYEILEKP